LSYQTVPLCPNHTARFTTRSLELCGLVPYYIGGSIRQGCYKYLCLDENPVLVDVGASVGLVTLIATFQSNIHVIAFEPYPVAAACLRDNIRLNGLENQVQVFPFGLSNQEETVKLVIPVGDKGNIGWARVDHPNMNYSKWGKTDSVMVPLRTLDSFEIPRITVLKIDVESYEHKVVIGSKKTVDRCQPIIVVETGLPAISPTVDLLREWNYEIFDIFHADVWLRPKGK